MCAKLGVYKDQSGPMYTTEYRRNMFVVVKFDLKIK